MKELLMPHRMCAFYAPGIFKEIEKSFEAYFRKSGLYKVVRCLTFMQKISDIDEQSKEI